MIASLDKIDLVVKELISLINKQNVIVLLRGDLASGKTTLVKSYVKALDIDDCVTSPTFSIQTVYGKDIYHYDVYNKSLNEFIALGLLEEFQNDGIHFVEWGEEDLEAVLNQYGFDVMVVKIDKLDNNFL